MELPKFDSTTPFYLKCSVVSVHIVSTLVVLSVVGEDSSFLSHPTAESSKAETDNQILSWPWIPVVKRTMYLFGQKLREMLPLTPNPVIMAYIPHAICTCCVAAACLPGTLVQSKYRSSTWTCMLFCLAYTHVCACSCAVAVHWFQCGSLDSKKEEPGTGGGVHTCKVDIFTIAFAFHSSVHCMYQCSQSFKAFTSKIRRCDTSTHIMGQPVLWVGIIFVNLLALVAPLISGGITSIIWNQGARSFQDIMTIHALVAFVPEMMGSLFRLLTLQAKESVLLEKVY